MARKALLQCSTYGAALPYCCIDWHVCSLYSSSADQTIKAWNIVTGKCEATLLPAESKHGDAITALTKIAKDGQEYLISGSLDGSMVLWDLSTPGKPVPVPTMAAIEKKVSKENAGGFTCLRLGASSLEQHY